MLVKNYFAEICYLLVIMLFAYLCLPFAILSFRVADFCQIVILIRFFHLTQFSVSSSTNLHHFRSVLLASFHGALIGFFSLPFRVHVIALLLNVFILLLTANMDKPLQSFPFHHI